MNIISNTEKSSQVEELLTCLTSLFCVVQVWVDSVLSIPYCERTEVKYSPTLPPVWSSGSAR